MTMVARPSSSNVWRRIPGTMMNPGAYIGVIFSFLVLEDAENLAKDESSLASDLAQPKKLVVRENEFPANLSPL